MEFEDAHIFFIDWYSGVAAFGSRRKLVTPSTQISFPVQAPISSLQAKSVTIMKFFKQKQPVR
jgi:hypothetical protein